MVIISYLVVIIFFLLKVIGFELFNLLEFLFSFLIYVICIFDFVYKVI